MISTSVDEVLRELSGSIHNEFSFGCSLHICIFLMPGKCKLSGKEEIISQFQDKLAFLGTSNICVIEERIIDLLSV